MDTRRYMGLLALIEREGKSLMCAYCGAETASLDATSLCSNCECIIHSTRAALAQKSPELVAALDSINKSIAATDFDAAIAAYEALAKGTEEPALLYVEALAQIKYSNYEISRISYDKSGYMEENAVHRDKAARLTSSAKLLMERGISMANAEMAQGNASVNLVYSLFLLEMKMNSLRAAADALQKLKGMTAGYVASYADVALQTALGNYAAVLTSVEKMVEAKQMPLNLFYYAAFAAMKSRDAKGARSVLEALSRMMKSSNARSLIDEMRSAESL